MRLATILDPSCVVPDVGSGSKHEVLARLAAPLGELRGDLDAGTILAELEAREAESSTAIADGIAIPHARPGTAGATAACLGLSRSGVDFDSLDGKRTNLFLVLVSPAADDEGHNRWLAHVARVLSDPSTRRDLLQSSDAGQVLATLARREDDLGEGAGS